MRLTITRRARSELLAATEYYAEASAAAADGFVDAYDRLLDQLELFPRSARMQGDGLFRALIPGFPWVIYYAIEGDTLRITRVLHARRSPDALDDPKP